MGWSLVLGGAVFSLIWLSLPPNALSRRSVLTEAMAETTAPDIHASAVVFGLAALGAALVVGWTIRTLGAVLLVIGPVAVLCAFAIRSLLKTWRQRQVRRRRQIAVIELCDAWSAEMRGGLPTAEALARSCASWPDFSCIVAADRVGGDVAEAMRVAAAQPGAEGLRAVAAAWEVATGSGAALADVIDRVATGLRHDDEARAEVTAALGPPRATAKMLAILPVFGLAMGTSMGAAPLDFLLHSEAGWLCLAGGVTLALLGLLWVERLAQSAEI